MYVVVNWRASLGGFEMVVSKNTIIDVKSESRILRRLRRVRARTYYLAVKYGGGPAFWNSKNKDTEFREVEV